MPDNLTQHKQRIAEQGFTIIPEVFTTTEVATILEVIGQADHSNPTFRKTADLFAIRQFLKEVPAVLPPVLITRLIALIEELFGAGYFVVKSIYFDKPEQSNWFVAYHQDLTSR